MSPKYSSLATLEMETVKEELEAVSLTVIPGKLSKIESESKSETLKISGAITVSF